MIRSIFAEHGIPVDNGGTLDRTDRTRAGYPVSVTGM